MDYKFNTLKVTLNDRILEVALNRPEKRNAMNPEMDKEVDRCLDIAEVDPDVKAVLIRGEGKVFSAGHDMKEFFAEPETLNYQYPERMPSQAPGFHRAWYFRKPLIAAVHGYVGAAGIALVSCADFIIAGEGTRFGYEIGRGSGSSAPPAFWSQLYVQLPMRAMEKLFLMGGWMDAREALQFHFVQRVVPEEDVVMEAQRWALQASNMPTTLFGQSKDTIRRSYEVLGLSAIPGVLNPNRPPPDPDADNFLDLVNKVGVKEAVRLRDENFDDEVSRV